LEPEVAIVAADVDELNVTLPTIPKKGAHKRHAYASSTRFPQKD